MGDPYKLKIAGHALAQGQASGRQWPHGSGEPKAAVCECGAASEPLKTVAERLGWHRQHKGDVIDAFVLRGVFDGIRSILKHAIVLTKQSWQALEDA